MTQVSFPALHVRRLCCPIRRRIITGTVFIEFVDLFRILAGLLFGILIRKHWISRSGMVAIGTALMSACFAMVYLSFPRLSSLEKTTDSGIVQPRYFTFIHSLGHLRKGMSWSMSFMIPDGSAAFSTAIVLVISFLMNVGDGCTTAQIMAFLVTHYADRSAQGFSIYMFYQVRFARAKVYF